MQVSDDSEEEVITLDRRWGKQGPLQLPDPEPEWALTPSDP